MEQLFSGMEAVRHGVTTIQETSSSSFQEVQMPPSTLGAAKQEPYKMPKQDFTE
jgi:hypothetical protein